MMTWIPCGLCHGCPCTCAWNGNRPWVGNVTYQPFLPQKLSDEDVDRIAKRVVDLLRGSLAGLRTGTLLTVPQDLDRGNPTNGGDFIDPDAQRLVDKVVAENTPKPALARRLTRRVAHER